MDHIVSTNLIENNQVNGVIYNALKFDSNSSLASPIMGPQPVVTIGLMGGKILEIW